MNKPNVSNELLVGRRKSAKPMLWISMVSMVMMFAGLTSAYVISSNREDWVSFDLPNAFKLSTLFILMSSASMHLAMMSIKKGTQLVASAFLIMTFILGLGFVWSQFHGFDQLKEMGLFFTGPNSEVSSSMLMVIVFLHLLHIFAAFIVLLFITIKQLLHKYDADNYLGMQLGAMFWHFLDVLWLLLFFFFYFNT